MNLDAYLDTFAGRQDCFATWDHDWQQHPDWLMPDHAAELHRSRTPLALYCLDDDRRSHVAAVDFDTAEGLDMARSLGAWLIAHGALPIIEPSRDGRAHLWIILDGRLDVTTLRRGLCTAMMDVPVIRSALAHPLDSIAGVPSGPLEFRPLTIPRALGNAMRAPLFPHPKTGETYPLIGPRGDRWESIADLTHVELTPVATWRKLAKGYPWRVDADALWLTRRPMVEVAA